MSELIDNRRHRIEGLKGMIRELHDGASPDELKGRFRAVLEHSGPSEISAMESELMAEGMPETEIRRMCELHVAVFRDKLEQRPPAETHPGHPVAVFKRENEVFLASTGELSALAANAVRGQRGVTATEAARWRDLHARLVLLDGHYKRKEYLVFPFLEKAGITAPPKVMWGIDDDIRERLAAASEAAREVEKLAADEFAIVEEFVLEPLVEAIEGMVEKEDRILWPMALEHLSDSDWGAVLEQWREFGPSPVEPEGGWYPSPSAVPVEPPPDHDGALALPSGHLSAHQLRAILDTLPLDITFVDADDRVAYFSEGPSRVFPRNRAIVGRRVQDCHPPASVHVVERVIGELRSGRRDVAEFWIQLHGQFVHIRYFAVRDENGGYLGVLETTQDVGSIRALEGERRLLAESGSAA